MSLRHGLTKKRIECMLTSNAVLKFNHEVVQAIEEEHKIDLRFPCYASDGKVLKTAIRANPGLIIVKDGVVLEKFHHTSYPPNQDLKTF